MILRQQLLIALICILAAAEAMYLPGVAPKDYSYGAPVELKVNKLTSMKAQLSYDYYKLPFCRPKEIKRKAENLGEILAGDVIENSPYEISFLVPETCKLLCRKQYKFFEVKKFMNKIKENYFVNWIVDNLPSAVRIPQESAFMEDLEYYQGFPIGGTLINPENEEVVEHFLNNHHRIIIKYHVHESGLMQKDIYDSFDSEDDFDEGKLQARIVGLDIEPFSVRHKYEGVWDDKNPPKLTTCKNIRREMTTEYLVALDSMVVEETGRNRKKVMKDQLKKELEVIWTYDVVWENSPIKWATRWDVYLNSEGKNSDDVHWFAIVNSLLIAVFLTGMVAMILMRTLYKDLSRYNRVPTEEEKAEDREETGWKLVHGDVFRAPKNPMLFSVTVGTGVQVYWVSLIAIFFSAIGFLSPANRGSLMLALLLLFVLLGFVAGYYSAKTYKSFNGKDWQTCTIATAALFPGGIFGLLFILNLIVWAEGSSNAIPFWSMISVLFLWFGISVPLTFLGAFHGYKQDVEEPPVRTHDIPRQIPSQPWFMAPFLTILMGGVLPFGACFVEIYSILSSLWMDKYYYVFGFLLLVFMILTVTCAEISVVLCYFQLCGEDYEWRWRSLFTSGSSALYLYGFSVMYYNSLEIDMFVSTILYFSYMAILSVLFFLATSVVGYFSCNLFVRKIYAAVKVD